MNDRIKQLWSQAGGHYDSGNQHTWPQYTIDNPEKFAELIVREHFESVGCGTIYKDGGEGRVPLCLAQPEQEPVALVDIHAFYEKCANFSLLQKLPKGEHYLYTTPPQRTWVGLTDEERLKLYRQFEDFLESDNWEYEKAIEAKLKQKNGFAEEKNT